MMVELLPPAESATRRVIESVLENLLADNTPLPSRIFVDDGPRSWRRHAAMLPVATRRSSVLAAATEASLVDALRFEIGGALWLPVSTPSMAAACEAAATREGGSVVPIATQGVFDAVIGDAVEFKVVGWWPPGFWQRQVGAVRPITRLVEIAERLAVVPLLVPGPVLVVVGRSRTEIEAACRDVDGGCGSSSLRASPRIVEFFTSDLATNRRLRIEDVLSGLAAERSWAEERSDLGFPVFELPSGRTVGQWSLTSEVSRGESPWRAFPAQRDQDGEWWELVRKDGSSEMVVESVSLTLNDVAGQSVIRTPGFVGADLRRGSPAALLIERLARHAARAGRPIWVPSVDAEAVRFLLGLAGPIWVDGPGVPG